MKATQIICSRVIVDGVLLEMVAWHVPFAVAGCCHFFKYRFYAGNPDGSCLVRYDNERGKGDHRHYGNESQEPYRFTTLIDLKTDFMRDVKRILKERTP
jgi:hypothetical protein